MKNDIPIQVDSDPSLLDLMLADSKGAPACYQATNYWRFMERQLLPELRTMNLVDFRRRRKSVLASFGATDLEIAPPYLDLLGFRVLNNRLTIRIPGYARWMEQAGMALSRFLPFAGGPRISAENLEKIAVDRAEQYAAKWGAKPLLSIGDSLVGNPGWSFEYGDKSYTLSFINKFMHYAYCCQFLNFSEISTVAELGPGLGTQAEVLKKLFPHLTIYLFDIPPQLYVCEQYLRKVFPGQVVGYRETRGLDALPTADGNIHIVGNWKFPLLKDAKIDLFWNTASFQEMEPDVVAEYLRLVNDSAKAVYLSGVLKGKFVAKGPGFPGVLRQTVLQDYEKGLPDFDRIHMDYTVAPLAEEANKRGYSSFWRRRSSVDRSSGERTLVPLG